MPTAYKVDFKDIIGRVSFEQLLPYLGLDQLRRINPTQFKGNCPFCNGIKSFVITSRAEKFPTGVFRCFKCPVSGDQLELVSLMRGHPRKDRAGTFQAAQELQEQFLTVKTVPENCRTVTRSVAGNDEAPRSRLPTAAQLERILGYIQPDAEQVRALGLEPDFAATWQIGYAPRGTMLNRVLIALQDHSGELIGFCGIATKPDDPQPFKYPSNIDLTGIIYPAFRLHPGRVRILGNPLEVALSYQADDEEQAVCFLTEVVGSYQLEMLSALVQERDCELVFN